MGVGSVWVIVDGGFGAPGSRRRWELGWSRTGCKLAAAGRMCAPRVQPG